MKRVGAVVLAAGASTRLGRPKQLVQLGGENLLERAIGVAREAGLSRILVVLGSQAEHILKNFSAGESQVILNHAWQEGIASSIRIGATALPDVDGAVFMTCDMPAVTAHHLRLLAHSDALTATAYAGRHGVPAFFPRAAFPLLLELRGDVGARQLLGSAPAIELPGGELDLDTEEDVAQAQQRFG